MKMPGFLKKIGGAVGKAIKTVAKPALKIAHSIPVIGGAAGVLEDIVAGKKEVKITSTAQAQPAVTTSTAPAPGPGVSGDNKTMLIIGGVLLAIFLLKGRK